ncbi:MAG: ABC transporter permease [Myxococcales bacterium]|nr:ABC transporter permease [Myxococcales bacterium]
MRRISWALVAIALLATLVFLVLRVFTPGDPAINILGENASEADLRAFRQRYQLDRPLSDQYRHFVSNLAHGSLGHSYEVLHRKYPVTAVIAEQFPWTMELALASMFIAFLIAVPLGLISALRQYSWVDNSATLLAFLGVAIPNFWLGPMLIVLFTIKLHWLPNPAGDVVRFTSLILPAFVLGTALSAKLMRMVRSSTLEVLDEDFVRTARAKGASSRRVLFRHVLRNAMIPVVTVMGMQFGALLGGAIVTEKVFARPGLGTLLLHAIEKRDFNVVQGCAVTILLCYIVVNTVVDLLYAAIDPRIRVAGDGR